MTQELSVDEYRKRTRIKETGPGGLTAWTTKTLEWVMNMYSDFTFNRNLQCNVVDGEIVPLPERELGRPDHQCLFRGQFFALELKSQKGKLSTWQKYHKQRIIDAGGEYFTPRTQEEIIEILASYGITRIRFN